MPRHAALTPDELRLVDTVLTALVLDQEPYHLEYPRLLARGLSEKQIAKELGKDPDIVEYHLENFFARAEGLARTGQERLITLALERYDALSKRERDALTYSEEAQRLKALSQVPSPEAIRRRAEKMLPEAKTKRERKPPQPDQPFPTKEDLIKSINKLPPNMRRLLASFVAFDEAPTGEMLAEAAGYSPTSMGAMSSALHGSLKTRASKSQGADREWLRKRFALIKEAAGSEGIVAAPRGKPRKPYSR